MTTASDPYLPAYLEALRPKAEWNLFHLSLHVARIGDPELEMDACQDEIHRLQDRTKARLPVDSPPYAIIERINEVLFGELGFRGNTEDYYDPRNSLMSQVLQRRTGIPITISLLYQEIAKAVGLEMDGVGMPGHFLLSFRASSRILFLDAFQQGQILVEGDCRTLCERLFGSEFEFQPSYLTPTPDAAILLRLLMNLKQIYRSRGESVRLRQVLNRRIPLLADPLPEILERGMVGVELEDYRAALEDFRHFARNTPEDSMRRVIETRIHELERLARKE